MMIKDAVKNFDFYLLTLLQVEGLSVCGSHTASPEHNTKNKKNTGSTDYWLTK